MVFRMIKLGGKKHNLEVQKKIVLEAYKDLEYRISNVHFMTASLIEMTTARETPSDKLNR